MIRNAVCWALITLTLLAGVICFYQLRITALNSENAELRNRLSYLEPPTPQTIQPRIPATLPYTVDEVMKKGTKIKFRLGDNDKWNRRFISLVHSKAWNSDRSAMFCLSG